MQVALHSMQQHCSIQQATLVVSTTFLFSSYWVSQGGESLALKRMEEHIADKAWVLQFEKPKGNPAALQPATTVLSPYLKFGCLSVRVFYQRLQQVGVSTCQLFEFEPLAALTSSAASRVAALCVT